MANMMELRIEIEGLTKKLAERDATIELLRKDPGQRGCDAALAIREGRITHGPGTIRSRAATAYNTSDCYVQFALKLLDDDRKLFDQARSGAIKLKRALDECKSRHADLEKKYARRRRSS